MQVIFMYHPGKVITLIGPKDGQVASSDQSTQATLRMWDENLLTLLVDAKLAPKMREGDLVLVDYRPIPGMRVPAPRQIVTKILRGPKAEAVWREYQLVLERIRRTQAQAQHQQQAYIQ